MTHTWIHGTGERSPHCPPPRAADHKCEASDVWEGPAPRGLAPRQSLVVPGSLPVAHSVPPRDTPSGMAGPRGEDLPVKPFSAVLRGGSTASLTGRHGADEPSVSDGLESMPVRRRRLINSNRSDTSAARW